ncbi:MAG: restriction endonuclease [Armatimonadetes bacterium]|nr:restriction endonuclease [Armatimonadota bacterium]
MTDVQVKYALQNCSLHSLLMLTSKALKRAGFGDVQILDRRQSRQKSRYGGHELLCQTEFGTVPAKVVVKVVRDSVRQRMLDELAGTVIRRNADMGILVATKHVSALARRNRERYNPLRLEIIDGDALAGLLAKYGIGVRPHGEVDYAFFGKLEEQSFRVLSFLASSQS